MTIKNEIQKQIDGVVEEINQKFNPYHVPAGSPEGGQFTSASGTGEATIPGIGGKGKITISKAPVWLLSKRRGGKSLSREDREAIAKEFNERDEKRRSLGGGNVKDIGSRNNPISAVKGGSLFFNEGDGAYRSNGFWFVEGWHPQISRTKRTWRKIGNPGVQQELDERVGEIRR